MDTQGSFIHITLQTIPELQQIALNCIQNKISFIKMYINEKNHEENQEIIEFIINHNKKSELQNLWNNRESDEKGRGIFQELFKKDYHDLFTNAKQGKSQECIQLVRQKYHNNIDRGNISITYKKYNNDKETAVDIWSPNDKKQKSDVIEKSSKKPSVFQRVGTFFTKKEEEDPLKKKLLISNDNNSDSSR